MQGSYGVRKSMGKVHFPAWTSLEKFYFGLLIRKKKLIFQTWSFGMHFHNILLKIENFAFIVLTVIVPAVNLGMSSGQISRKVLIFIQIT